MPLLQAPLLLIAPQTSTTPPLPPPAPEPPRPMAVETDPPLPVVDEDEPPEPPPVSPAGGPPTDWGEVHDDRDVFQASPDELTVIDIHSL